MTLDLEHWASVRGRAVDADGRPIADATIVAGSRSLLSTTFGGSNSAAMALVLMGSFGTTTDSDGRFELRQVAADTDWLILLDPATGMPTLRLVPIAAESGSVVDAGTLVATPKKPD